MENLFGSLLNGDSALLKPWFGIVAAALWALPALLVALFLLAVIVTQSAARIVGLDDLRLRNAFAAVAVSISLTAVGTGLLGPNADASRFVSAGALNWVADVTAIHFVYRCGLVRAVVVAAIATVLPLVALLLVAMAVASVAAIVL
jgi:hypothetical protein